MQMSAALEISLIAASIAIVLLVIGLGFAVLMLRRQIQTITQTLEQVRGEAQLALRDSRVLIQNLTHLVTRIETQTESIGHIVGVVDGWTQRADRIVDAVGSTVEPPVFAVLRNANVLRDGLVRFVKTFLRSNHKQHNQETHHG